MLKRKTFLSLCGLLACGSLGLHAMEGEATPLAVKKPDLYTKLRPTPTAPKPSLATPKERGVTYTIKSFQTRNAELVAEEQALRAVIKKVTEENTNVTVTTTNYVRSTAFIYKIRFEGNNDDVLAAEKAFLDDRQEYWKHAERAASTYGLNHAPERAVLQQQGASCCSIS